KRTRDRLAVRSHPADRDAPEADAMIPALASDEHPPRALAARPVITESDLQRGVHRLGTGVDEEDVVEAPRGEAHELVGGDERTGGMHLKAGRVVEPLRLSLDGFDDRLAAVACVHGPEPGDTVKDPTPVV